MVHRPLQIGYKIMKENSSCNQKEFIWRGQGYDWRCDLINNTKYNCILPLTDEITYEILMKITKENNRWRVQDYICSGLTGSPSNLGTQMLFKVVFQTCHELDSCLYEIVCWKRKEFPKDNERRARTQHMFVHRYIFVIDEVWELETGG